MMGVRDGDLSNLAPLFDRHSARLFNYYVRLTGNRQLSEDMVQDVFLRILTYRHTFRGESQFTTWMFTIARNVQVDNHRRWGREQPFRYDRDDHEGVYGDDEPVSDDSVDYRYDAALLQESLLKLSPEKREALIMSRYQGMKYSEIAEVTGTSVENVKVRIHRAVNDLRKLFTGGPGRPKPPEPPAAGQRNMERKV
jgi:RNA polymerase sigma factor (sigma-70 family)